jgi:hypothetical protein
MACSFLFLDFPFQPRLPPFGLAEMPPGRSPPLLPLLAAAEPRSREKPDPGQRLGGPFFSSARWWTARDDRVERRRCANVGRHGPSTRWRAPQRAGERWWRDGVRWSSTWMFHGGSTGSWLRRRSGGWLNGGPWRFAVGAGGCAGNQSRRWPWSALSRQAGGASSQDRSREAMYGESWALASCAGRAFSPPCFGWAFSTPSLLRVH